MKGHEIGGLRNVYDILVRNVETKFNSRSLSPDGRIILE
jgi:hypothetical protein